MNTLKNSSHIQIALLLLLTSHASLFSMWQYIKDFAKEKITREYATVIVVPFYENKFVLNKMELDIYEKESISSETTKEYETEEEFEVTFEVPQYTSEGEIMSYHTITKTEKRPVSKTEIIKEEKEKEGKKLGTDVNVLYFFRSAISKNKKDIDNTLTDFVRDLSVSSEKKALGVKEPQLVMVQVFNYRIGNLFPARETIYVYALDVGSAENLEKIKDTQKGIIVSDKELLANKLNADEHIKEKGEHKISFDYYNDLFVKNPNFITFINTKQLSVDEIKRAENLQLYEQLSQLHKDLQSLLAHINAYTPVK